MSDEVLYDVTTGRAVVKSSSLDDDSQRILDAKALLDEAEELIHEARVDTALWGEFVDKLLAVREVLGRIFQDEHFGR